MLGKGEVLPILGLCTSLQRESIPWGMLRLCSENHANFRGECYVLDGRMGLYEVFIPNKVDGVWY